MDAIRDTNFRPETRRRIRQMAEIIDEYDQALTARQLFYQLVSRDLIPNTPRSYQQTTKLLTDARYAGLISWSAIEDRGRVADTPSYYDSVREVVDVAARAFKLDRWAGQPNYVEVWVEKQALAGVQIKKYRPPPNPAKLTDSRAAGYIAQHGNKSWELDALPPRDLNHMVSAAIAGLCDGELREAVIAKETTDRERLKRATAKIK